MSGHFLHELRMTFETRAAHAAVVYRERMIRYGELDPMARRSAGWLQSLGVMQGDRVVLYTSNKLPFLVAHLGALYAGAVSLPLNPRFTREEMRYYLSDSEARVVVAGREQRALLAELTPQLPKPPLVVADEAALDPPAASFHEPTIAGDDPCLILYSSGTTGWPKGVVHSHGGAAGSLRSLAACWRMTPDDVVVNVLPLFHIHGLAFATHLTWLVGGCVRIEDAFDPVNSLDAIGRGTVFMAVPPIYYRLLEEPAFRKAAATWTGMRLFTCGSAPIRPEVLPELETILGRPIINRYGMSEAYVITSLPLEGPWPAGSVGWPLKGIELRVVQDDESRSRRPGGTSDQPTDVASNRLSDHLPPGEQVLPVGSVLIRGPNLFREYWRKPEATQAAFADGWFDTGDLGSLDEHGMLTLVGRKHDLIITSGYNVYPQVVERVIGECPGVRECAVFGVPDAQRGESVAAAVVRSNPALDEATLHAWWRERLVHYQQPRQVLFVESLPRNTLGKVLRRELRERLLQEKR